MLLIASTATFPVIIEASDENSKRKSETSKSRSDKNNSGLTAFQFLLWRNLKRKLHHNKDLKAVSCGCLNISGSRHQKQLNVGDGVIIKLFTNRKARAKRACIGTSHNIYHSTSVRVQKNVAYIALHLTEARNARSSESSMLSAVMHQSELCRCYISLQRKFL